MRAGRLTPRCFVWVALLATGCPQVLDDDFLVIDSSGMDDDTSSRAGAPSGGSVIKTDQPDAGLGRGAGENDSDSDAGDASSGAGGTGGSPFSADGGTDTSGGAGGVGGDTDDGPGGSGGAGGAGATGGPGGSDGGAGGLAMTDAGVPVDDQAGGGSAGGSNGDLPEECTADLYQDRVYLFCLLAVDHETAVAWCQGRAMRLARSNGASEGSWLYQTISDLGAAEYWIDGSRSIGGPWTWGDGDPIPLRGRLTGGYQAWALGEPTQGDDEGCVSVQEDGWHDRPCGELMSFVCEQATP